MRAAFPQLDLVLIALMVLCVATVASAAEIGQIKISRGQVTVERDGFVFTDLTLCASITKKTDNQMTR